MFFQTRTNLKLNGRGSVLCAALRAPLCCTSDVTAPEKAARHQSLLVSGMFFQNKRTKVPNVKSTGFQSSVRSDVKQRY